jgi:hypothetical protein
MRWQSPLLCWDLRGRKLVNHVTVASLAVTQVIARMGDTGLCTRPLALEAANLLPAGQPGSMPSLSWARSLLRAALE